MRKGATVSFFLATVSAACGRSHSPPDPQPEPPASVATLAIDIGACDDVSACEEECKRGSADRCRRLGATYAFGKGTPRDETHATALYERACVMKDPAACVFAGQMREYGHGVPADGGAASQLYKRSCDLGWAAGCYNLAIMVENGRGVPRDAARAADLYQIACTAGAKVACDKSTQLRMAPVVLDR